MPQPAPLASRRRSKEMAGLDKILFRRTDNNRAAQKGISSDSCCLCYRMNLDRGPLPPPIHGHARIRYRSLQVRVWRGVSATDISLTRSWIFFSFFFFFSDLFKDRYARKLKTIFARKLFWEFLRYGLKMEEWQFRPNPRKTLSFPVDTGQDPPPRRRWRVVSAGKKKGGPPSNEDSVVEGDKRREGRIYAGPSRRWRQPLPFLLGPRMPQ